MSTNLRIPPEVEGAWEQGPAISVTVVDENDDGEVERRIRISVTRALPAGKLWASYEEEVLIRVEDKPRRVWARVTLPPASGKTPEECLQNALDVVAGTVQRRQS